jgi:hypothetical protein
MLRDDRLDNKNIKNGSKTVKLHLKQAIEIYL